MFKIILAVALLWTAYNVDLNKDYDGQICQTVCTQNIN